MSATHRRAQLKINAARCNITEEERVFPDTIIGEDWETGEPVEAGCSGVVEHVAFSGGEHALIVTIAAEED